MTTYCGTPTYMAPEILRNQDYDSSCDIFSLGSILFNIMTGRVLFKGSSKQMLVNANKVCDLSNAEKCVEQFGNSMITDLLFGMLQTNPNRRLALKDILVHPWFSEEKELIE